MLVDIPTATMTSSTRRIWDDYALIPGLYSQLPSYIRAARENARRNFTRLEQLIESIGIDDKEFHSISSDPSYNDYQRFICCLCFLIPREPYSHLDDQEKVTKCVFCYECLLNLRNTLKEKDITISECPIRCGSTLNFGYVCL